MGRTNSVTVRRKRILMIFKFASFPVPDPLSMTAFGCLDLTIVVLTRWLLFSVS